MISYVPGYTIESVEKMIIQQAFAYFKGNKTQTAQAIGIAIRTLDAKLEKYESDDREHKLKHEQLQRQRDAVLARQRAIPGSNPELTARIQMESVTQVLTEQVMSVSQRSEIQEVLPQENRRQHSGSNRRASRNA